MPMSMICYYLLASLEENASNTKDRYMNKSLVILTLQVSFIGQLTSKVSLMLKYMINDSNILVPQVYKVYRPSFLNSNNYNGIFNLENYCKNLLKFRFIDLIFYIYIYIYLF